MDFKKFLHQKYLIMWFSMNFLRLIHISLIGIDSVLSDPIVPVLKGVGVPRCDCALQRVLWAKRKETQLPDTLTEVREPLCCQEELLVWERAYNAGGVGAWCSS